MKVLIVHPLEERKDLIWEHSADWLDNQFSWAHGVDEAIIAIRKLQPNLVVVDVAIERGRGFQIFEETASMAYDKIVITKGQEHIVKSIRFNVCQTLFKPLKMRDLIHEIERIAFKKRENGIQQMYRSKILRPSIAIPDAIAVSVNGSSRLLRCNDILLIEEENGLCTVTLEFGHKLFTDTDLERFNRLLIGHEFCHLSSDALINLGKITNITQQDDQAIATFTDGRQIPVSYRVESCFKKRSWRTEIRGDCFGMLFERDGM